MQLQLVRSATLRLTYNNHLFIIDPYFAPKHSLRSYTGKSPNPLIDLPFSIDEALAGVEMAVVSHLHSDHFDSVAQERLPKTLPIFCQPGDEAAIREKGFTDMTPIEASIDWGGIHIQRTAGEHGTGATGQLMGKVSGFVFRAPGEPTLYWAGDTIWYDAVQRTVEEVQPDIIVTHSSGAVWGDDPNPIVMDVTQTIAVCQFAPNATVIATHLDSLDHGTVSREDLRAAADAAGISRTQLRIPLDGETLTFEQHTT
jgi:L-ascorbate metabolism protein UlaG (beta-lactamase superfamily)